MPDPAAAVGRLRVVPDLVIEVEDGRGGTTARLRSDPGHDRRLLLDVDDPQTFVRCLPRGAGRTAPARLVDAPSVRLVSHGRDLGRFRVTASGRIRYRATARGIAVGTRVVLHRHGPAVTLGAGAALLGALAVATGVRTVRRR